MNDTELDEILDTWSAPPAPASLRESVRAGFAASLEQKTTHRVLPLWIGVFMRKSLLAGALLVAGAFLLLVGTQAFPQTPPGRIPYTVESELVRYADDGSSTVEMYTSYNDSGREIILSRSFPGDPLRTVGMQLLDVWRQLALRLAVSSEQIQIRSQVRAQKAAALIRAGCVDGEELGRETILNHLTVASRLRLGDGRATVWMAPDLGCFALRIKTEKQNPDGTFRMVIRKQALRVTVNP